MKVTIIFLSAMIFMFTDLVAQLDPGFGVKAGINISTQKTIGEGINVNTKSLVGFHLGVYGNYFFLEQLAVQLELLYSQKGSKWSDPYFTGRQVELY